MTLKVNVLLQLVFVNLHAMWKQYHILTAVSNDYYLCIADFVGFTDPFR